MPKRKQRNPRRSSSKGKRRRVVRTTRPRNRVTFVSPGAPIADKSVISLRFCKDFALDPTIATPVAVHRFGANGLYDPEVGAPGGHQPLGFDQWMGFYANYHVKAAKIAVHYYSPQGDSYGFIVGIRVSSGDVTAYGGLTEVCELPGTKFGPMGGNSSGKSITTVTHGVNITRFIGRSYLDDTNMGNSAANPTEDVQFHCFASRAEATGEQSPILCFAVITFLAQFSERKTLPQS